MRPGASPASKLRPGNGREKNDIDHDGKTTPVIIQTETDRGEATFVIDSQTLKNG